MTVFYKDPESGEFRPDRRSRSESTESERRTQDATRISHEQYEFLKDTLFRREDLQAQVAKRGRLIRHVLFVVAVVFVVIIFAAPDFKLSLNGLGINQDVTILQLSAIAPLIIAYLILHACHLGATRLRLVHECKAIELGLERFSTDTSYSLLREYRAKCLESKELWQEFVSTNSYLAVYSLYEFFLGFSVMMAFSGSVYIAVGAYSSISPGIAVVFFVYLAIAIFASLLAPVALKIARSKKDEFMDKYIEARIPNRLHVFG